MAMHFEVREMPDGKFRIWNLALHCWYGNCSAKPATYTKRGKAENRAKLCAVKWGPKKPTPKEI